ncbi:MAG: hypothetical protein ABF470_07355, partial [Liquorilactobacillus sp.]|uniref:hypothetical protein n=2 Tax=Liquorilactobacillus sp. TaxID=2767923 RepID=UPI0039EBA33C
IDVSADIFLIQDSNSNGETYEMDYEITLTASFHNLTGTLPISVTNVAYAEYETDQKKIAANPNPIKEYIEKNSKIILVVAVIVLNPETDLGIGVITGVGIIAALLS